MTNTPVRANGVPWLFEARKADLDGRESDAIDWYRSIATSGDPRGDTALGMLLLRSSDADHRRDAVDALTRASAHGDIAGTVALGIAHEMGTSVEADAGRARDLFEAAGEQGSSEGARRAGELWWSDAVGPSDAARAVTWWKRALTLGDEPAALLGLADVAISEANHVEAVGWAIRAAYVARRLLETPSPDRRWSPDADEIDAVATTLAGELEAAMDLVNQYRVEVYDAAEEHDADACWHWGRIVSLGFGDVPDPDGGEGWIEVAATRGQPQALHALAQADRRNGDVAQFERRLRAAADAGDASALHDLGYALHSGAFDDDADIEGAIEAYRRAAKIDPAKTAADLSFVLEDRPGEDAATESMAWLRVAAANGDPAAQRRLGERCRDGDGIARDPASAARWFLSAHYLGWDGAIATLGAFASELSADDLSTADRFADGTGEAAASLLEHRRAAR